MPVGHGRLILLCGRAYSGKTTTATALQRQLGATVLSLDDINKRRGLSGGDGMPIGEWARTNEIAGVEVRSMLATHETVIVDDTASLRYLRDVWRRIASEAGADFVLVYVDADRETIRQRQADNRAQPHRPDVSDAVLRAHLDSFEPPDLDEHAVLLSANDEISQWIQASLVPALEQTS